MGTFGITLLGGGLTFACSLSGRGGNTFGFGDWGLEGVVMLPTP